MPTARNIELQLKKSTSLDKRIESHLNTSPNFDEKMMWQLNSNNREKSILGIPNINEENLYR